MPRPLSIAIIASLWFTSVVMADDKPSPTVKRILDKAVGEVKKNLADFSKKSEKPLGDARLELQELSKKLIEDGKTVDATAVLKQIETLEADVMRMAKAPEHSGGGGKPAPQKPLLERMAGRWSHGSHDHAFFIEPNGNITEVVKRNGQVNSRGRAVNISDDVVEVRLENGYKSQMGLVGDKILAMVWWEPSGKPMQGWFFERIK
jgi:hypothetical protein